MADPGGFQAQIASIIEILANSAVAEICKLVDDGYAALRAQMERERQRSDTEKDALRHKLREMDVKVRSYERKMRRRIHHFRPPEGVDLHLPGARLLPVPSEDKPFLPPQQQDGAKVAPLVKQEREEGDECNLDLKVEVNIRAECSLASALDSGQDEPPADPALDPAPATFSAPQPPSHPSDSAADQTGMPRVKRKACKPLCGGSTPPGPDDAPKPEIQNDDGAEEEEEELEEEVNPSSQLPAPPASDQPSPERLGSLSLDLAWMQERVSHLGAAYAVAQLGLGGAESGHPAASFPSQGVDSLDGPPTMLFAGGAHEMAVFAASFDMAAAATATAVTAPPPPPPPPPPAAPSAAQRRPYRGGAAAKEPVACAVCGRVFPGATALELHRRVHTGERPYTCPHCGKGFAQPNNLRVHLLIHTGERRYRCTLCGKSFISSSHLKRHRTVHTQEKPYSCSRCGQSFSQMCSVRRHRQQSQCGL